jgi:tripartite-type tricarboxylate transporter receptor subunit TctC
MDNLPRHAGALARWWPKMALIALVLASAGMDGQARAAYPDRPIRIVVAYAAGGTGDLVGRLVAEGLRVRLGVSVVVENQGGAAGAIATTTVARSKPDGYTLLLAGNALFAILPHITKVNYDPVTNFTAVANLSEAVRVLAVNKSVSATTLKEFVAYAKSNPGKVNYGSAGIGSTLHIMTEMFHRAAGFDAVHVPFRGSGPATQALLQGDIQFLIDTAVLPYVESGDLRALAAASDRRIPSLPHLPTLAELGYPTIRTSGWQALLGPAGLPQKVVDVLSKHLAELLKDPAFVSKLAKIGVTQRYRGPSELDKDLREDHQYFGAVLEQLQLKKR